MHFALCRPHLGHTLNKIVSVGLLYFILGTLEATLRIYKVRYMHAYKCNGELTSFLFTAQKRSVQPDIGGWHSTSLVGQHHLLVDF